MLLPDVYDAANLQKSRSQDLSSALIRCGSMQLQPDLPPAKLLAGEPRGIHLPPVDLSFHPQICKTAKLEDGYSEHLHDRVAQSRLLDDDLKADCLQRLVAVAQRAPVPSQLAEEAPESSEPEEVITKEDLVQEVTPEPPEGSEPRRSRSISPEAESPKGLDPSRRSVMEAKLREVLTPTPELLQRAEATAQAQDPSPSSRYSLGNLLGQNQHLAARAGLSSFGDCTWRPTAPTDAADAGQQGLPARHLRRKRDSISCGQVDLYSGWPGDATPATPATPAAALHWRFQSRSPWDAAKKAPSAAFSRACRSTAALLEPAAEPGIPEAPGSIQLEAGALPISMESLEETRQAVAAAKAAAEEFVAQRGITSVLRHALRMVAQPAAVGQM